MFFRYITAQKLLSKTRGSIGPDEVSYTIMFSYALDLTLHINYMLFAKNFEPLIYISIYIYRVHCRMGSLENLLPTRVMWINMSYLQYI